MGIENERVNAEGTMDDLPYAEVLIPVWMVDFIETSDVDNKIVHVYLEKQVI